MRDPSGPSAEKWRRAGKTLDVAGGNGAKKSAFPPSFLDGKTKPSYYRSSESSNRGAFSAPAPSFLASGGCPAYARCHARMCEDGMRRRSGRDLLLPLRAPPGLDRDPL